MKLISAKFIPLWIAVAVIALVCLVREVPRVFPKLDLFQRLEWMTYDWRVRSSTGHPKPVATNLGAVFIDDDSLKSINTNIEYGFSYPWPRKLYGSVVKELSAEGAKVIGFDIFFIESFSDTDKTKEKIGNVELGSDEYFAYQLRRSKRVVLGAPSAGTNGMGILAPTDLLRTNAMAVGHAVAEADSDGVLRRVIPFYTDPALGRVWQMGIVMAAKALDIDLTKAEIYPDRIILRGKDVVRTIPLDEKGYFYINWSLKWNDPRINKDSFEDVLDSGQSRAKGQEIDPYWKDEIVVVGSIGSGNNISDMGSTSLEKVTYLVSKHWNVVNSILTNSFISRSSTATELLLIIFMGALSALITWKLHAPWPTLVVLAIGAAYSWLALYLYVEHRYWLPIVLPVAGSLIMNHVSAVTYQVLFEQTEKRRVKSVFSRVVSPNVVNELLKAGSFNADGSRAAITVFFADVRGFTKLTDQNQDAAEKFVKDHNLTGAAAEAHFDESARETLYTVNLYLATIADQIIKHEGTLDKYIGDCVMAFWGAPTHNPKHAASCIYAAVDAQRAMAELNLERQKENERRKVDNVQRVAEGKYPLPLQAVLALGTGINTGVAIVGLMGSSKNIVNYTVFGREINLASRLEGLSGRGRIIIGENTYNDLKRDDPDLAAKCIEQPAAMLKGFEKECRNWEVPWKLAAPPAEAAAAPSVAGAPIADGKSAPVVPTPAIPTSAPVEEKH